MSTTKIARRLRGYKLHSWVNKDLLTRFDKYRIAKGLSRDGALEQALKKYLNIEEVTDDCD